MEQIHFSVPVESLGTDATVWGWAGKLWIFLKYHHISSQPSITDHHGTACSDSGQWQSPVLGSATAHHDASSTKPHMQKHVLHQVCHNMASFHIFFWEHTWPRWYTFLIPCSLTQMVTQHELHKQLRPSINFCIYSCPCSILGLHGQKHMWVSQGPWMLPFYKHGAPTLQKGSRSVRAGLRALLALPSSCVN